MEKISKLNFVDLAEETIKSLRVKNRKGELELKITTSKIRNLLSLTNTLYNSLLRLKDDTLSEDVLSNIQYIRMKFAYEAGRDKDVNDFIEKADLINQIKSIGSSKEQAMNFCRYMESLVAYHKFYGGR